MTKEQRTIKELTQQVADLKVDLENKDANLKRTEEYRKRGEDELSDIHATFDLLGVPRCSKDSYRNLSANARLTLFLAQRSGIQIKKDATEEGE